MSKNDSNANNLGAPITPAQPKDNTGKIVIIIFIILAIVIIGIPIAIFAVVYFMIFKPMMDSGLDRMISFPSGRPIESSYSRSINQLYEAYEKDGQVARISCLSFGDFVDDATDNSMDLCYDDYMLVSFGESEDGHLEITALSEDDEIVVVETNHSITKYYSLKIMNSNEEGVEYKKLLFLEDGIRNDEDEVDGEGNGDDGAEQAPSEDINNAPIVF